MADALLKDASAWANLVKGGVIQGVELAKGMAGVLSSDYKLSAGEASKLPAKAGCDVGDVAGPLKGVYGLSAKETARTRTQALRVSDQAMAAVNTAKKKTHTVTKGFSDGAKKAGHAVNKAGNSVMKAFKL